MNGVESVYRYCHGNGNRSCVCELIMSGTTFFPFPGTSGRRTTRAEAVIERRLAVCVCVCVCVCVVQASEPFSMLTRARNRPRRHFTMEQRSHPCSLSLLSLLQLLPSSPSSSSSRLPDSFIVSCFRTHSFVRPVSEWMRGARSGSSRTRSEHRQDSQQHEMPQGLWSFVGYVCAHHSPPGEGEPRNCSS
jgi:hypothetical protein